ncbi:molybdenum ABC transporter ATP-binding protein [Halomonas dongshanensis]|uniref:Molybdenum ABC transporter ATP-binding protein n=1 Tax=Halomonas dongshanensis TaxID=2890835 RepID=A0ABT2EGL7_9GAMM|nr:molybdenum ABC transporter ATP-binding protein [Halomonas dongshanensis]MCS2610695.1 molybdenum ABC transporter ATP-binding protein [Halomonas dongshanensis]
MADTPSSRLCLDVDQRLGQFHLQAALDLPGHGVTGIFGTSGSGKTSVLRVIAGLERPSRGRFTLGDKTLLDTQRRRFVPPHRRRIGVVFQEARLFPHYSVRRNLTYGIPHGVKAQAISHFDDTVELLGISALLDRMPGTLSGGEARRVAIGRALLSDPQLLLMDEPLTGLDGARKAELLQYILRLTQQVEIPVIYVSHDPDEITTIADHLVLMRAGRVEASDRLPALLQRFDLTQALSGFDATSILEGCVSACDPDYHLIRVALDQDHHLTLPGVLHEGSRVRLRIRARDIAIALTPLKGTSYRNQLPATIDAITTLPESPHTVELRLRLGAHRLRSRLTKQAFDELALAEGQEIVALIRSVAVNAL